MSLDVRRRNNVNVLGKGAQPMLFVHGFGCDQNMWRFVTPAFEEDYQIVLMDYVGSGKSDLSAYNRERYSDLNGYAQDIIEVCAAMQLKEVIAVGHSVSSMTVLLAAIKEPHVFSRLVLVAPSPCYINKPPDYIGGFEKKDIAELLDTMEKNYIGWANFLAPVVMGNSDRPALTKELTESFCSTDPTVAHDFARATFFSDNRADVAKCKIPSLILQCTNDAVAPVAVGEYMRDHLPSNSFSLLNASGHCPHMSAPGETIEAIKEFLNRTDFSLPR